MTVVTVTVVTVTVTVVTVTVVTVTEVNFDSNKNYSSDRSSYNDIF